MRDFSEIAKELRLSKHLTQSQLAERMWVKKSIISYQDTLIDSPYNTYMYPGLPVGPICCPGTDSVEATLYYADNDYYYFQSDESGKLHFAETYEEHAAIQSEVQATWKGEVIEDYNE